MAGAFGNLMPGHAMEPQPNPTTAQHADEDRILRVWTPMLLRTILLVAVVLLASGLIVMAVNSPGSYVERYHQVRMGKGHDFETLHELYRSALHGDPHGVLTMGLFVLTLVPLGRVAFCFLLFIKERDYTYVGFTAYVLAGLVLGVILGRVG
jgi:uncharacterized membrane protein